MEKLIQICFFLRNLIAKNTFFWFLYHPIDNIKKLLKGKNPCFYYAASALISSSVSSIMDDLYKQIELVNEYYKNCNSAYWLSEEYDITTLRCFYEKVSLIKKIYKTKNCIDQIKILPNFDFYKFVYKPYKDLDNILSSIKKIHDEKL